MLLSDIRLELSRLNAAFVPFTAKTRKSGIDYHTRIRKDAAEAVKAFVLVKGGEYPDECEQTVKRRPDGVTNASPASEKEKENVQKRSDCSFAN